jgi:hypothetical protein
MNWRKRIGLVLLLTGVVLVVMAGFSWRQTAPRGNEIATQRAALEDSARAVHNRLMENSLKLQGFRNSQSAIPDTLRRFGGNKLMEISAGYNKIIRKLEMQERDIKLQISALSRESERNRAHTRATVTPVAAAGLVALVAGVVLVLIPRRGVGA